MNLGKLQSLKVMTLNGNRVTTLPDECKFLFLQFRGFSIDLVEPLVKISPLLINLEGYITYSTPYLVYMK